MYFQENILVQLRQPKNVVEVTQVFLHLEQSYVSIICVSNFTWISFLCYSRLLVTEKAGAICRDDSVEGLRFYPNKFLEVSA